MDDTGGFIRFHVPAIPIAQPRPRAVKLGNHARVYGAPAKHPVHDFKATVRMASLRSYMPVGFKPLRCPLSINLVFILPRPASKIWKRRPMPRLPHTSRPDCDNLTKSLLDALTGTIWHDDAQIYRCTAEKYVAAGDEQPHVEVEIRYQLEDSAQAA